MNRPARLKMNIVWCVLGILLFLNQCLPLQAEEDSLGEQIIRIAVLKDVTQIPLSVLGRYTVINPLNGDVLSKGRRMRHANVMSTSDGIRIDEEQTHLKRVRIRTPKDILIHRGNKDHRFRGEMEIIQDEKGNLLVINLLDVERYVKGVLYHEVTDRWPIEAMKAQAVAARTYALYRILNNDGKEYDLTSDIYSQVYGGRSAERYRTNIAVNRTRGMILTYQDKILPAYYHSSCGGTTENVSELWEQEAAPLKGRICTFCKGFPHSHWKKNYRLKDFENKLNAQGYHVDLIKEINVLERNNSGRIRTLEIVTRKGKRVKIAGRKFRDIIGPNIIKSNKYDVTMKGYYVDLVGSGWGHGVGMCQWGAYGMAKKRHAFDEILQYYYPGAELTDCREVDCKKFLVKEEKDKKKK